MNPMQNHDTRVPDMIGSLSEADILTSQQYYNQEASGRQPERSLMLAAVITRQIECLEAAYRVADLLLRPQREDPWLKNISCLQFLS